MSCSKTTCREEFRCKNFGLGHTNPKLFVTSQCGPTVLFPIWNAFWLLYHVIWLFFHVYLDAVDNNLPDQKWFIFLTNWGYTVLNLAALYDFFVTNYVQIRCPEIMNGKREDMPWYLMLDWLFFNVANGISILVTVGYYGFIGSSYEARSIEKHFLNTIYILLNFFMCAKPVRLLHFYQSMVFLFIYGIFSLIYQLSTGEAIYPILDWYKVGQTLGTIFGLGVAGLPAFHLLFFGLYHLRLFVARKCCKARVHVDAESPGEIEMQKY